MHERAKRHGVDADTRTSLQYKRIEPHSDFYRHRSYGHSHKVPLSIPENIPLVTDAAQARRRTATTLYLMFSLTFRIWLFIVVSTGLSGCSLFDSGTEWKSGPFEVLWIDLTSDSHLAYRLSETTSIQIVQSCVFSAGANAEYVVAKQRPNGTLVTNFYVIPIKKYSPSADARKIVIGPLSESEYQEYGEKNDLPVLTNVLPESVCTKKV